MSIADGCLAIPTGQRRLGNFGCTDAPKCDPQAGFSGRLTRMTPVRPSRRSVVQKTVALSVLAVCSLRLRNRIAKRGGIIPDAVIPGNDCHQWRRLPEQLRCREMNGIERADGFNRERPPYSSQHGVRDRHDVAAAFKPSQRVHRRPFLFRRQAARSTGTKNRAGGFREGEC
jgi:hypothetical protein